MEERRETSRLRLLKSGKILLGKASVHVACPADVDTPLYQEEVRSRPDWLKAAIGSGFSGSPTWQSVA